MSIDFLNNNHGYYFNDNLRYRKRTIYALFSGQMDLFCPVWPRSGAEGEVPAEIQTHTVTAHFAEVQPPPLAVPIEVLEPAAAQSPEPEEPPPCNDTTEIPEEKTPSQKSASEPKP